MEYGASWYFFFKNKIPSFLNNEKVKTKPKIWEGDVPLTKAVYARTGDGFACGFANGVVEV